MRTLLLLSLLGSAAVAADLPVIPAESIAKKGDLLFSDDFKSATADPRWHRVVDTFTREDGALKGMQTRDKNIPAADGKPEVTAHSCRLRTRDSDERQRHRSEAALRRCGCDGRRV